jgi:hypothetical protein
MSNIQTTGLHVYDSSSLAVDAYHTSSKYSDTTWLSIKTRGREISIFVNDVEELANLAHEILQQVSAVMLKESDKLRKELRAAQDEEEEVPF